MLSIFDSETHPWTRLPSNWRYRALGEPREPLPAGYRTYFWPASQSSDSAPVPLPPSTADELLAGLDAAGVTSALVMPGPFVTTNAMVADVAAAGAGRLVGFAKFGPYLPPWRTNEHRTLALDELEHGLRDLGLRGVGELWCGEWWPEPSDSAQRDLRYLFDLCRSYDVPIAFHCAPVDSDYRDLSGPGRDSGSPALLAGLAAEFPTVPLLLFHMGAGDQPFFDLCVDLARKHPRVLLNTSLSTPAHVVEAVRRIGNERLLFGSDWYALVPPDAGEHTGRQHNKQLQSVLNAPIGDADKERILWKNLDGLLRAAGRAARP